MTAENVQSQSVVPATVAEAERLGLRKIDKPKKWRPGGLLLSHSERMWICYIGPCDPDTKTRELCYYAPDNLNGGCNICFEWDDRHCQ
jgi:hypothetical protein